MKPADSKTRSIGDAYDPAVAVIDALFDSCKRVYCRPMRLSECDQILNTAREMIALRAMKGDDCVRKVSETPGMLGSIE